MPRTSRYSLPSASDLPGTLKRSQPEAQEMFIRALAGAVQKYGAGDQASRAAYAELKQTFEKRGDHWIPKQDQAPLIMAPAAGRAGQPTSRPD